jgi:hypothetical protein
VRNKVLRDAAAVVVVVLVRRRSARASLFRQAAKKKKKKKKSLRCIVRVNPPKEFQPKTAPLTNKQVFFLAKFAIF